jgi:hypothetical protein
LQADLLHHRSRVAEAMALLLTAKFLIHVVPLGWWRRSLGEVRNSVSIPKDADTPTPVVTAVNRAALRLPGEYVCLPRAMAVQWMLRRRGISASLVFGIAADQQHGALHALHAWVESGGTTIIGGSEQVYHRGLVLSH